MRLRVLGTLAVLLAGAAASTGAAQEQASWVRVATPRFEVVAEVSPKRAVEVARRLEAFRSMVEENLPDAAAALQLQPALAVVFARDAAFSSFTPNQPGRVSRVAAFVGLDPLSPCLSFHLEREDESLRMALREYARVLLRQTPLWFMEGAAEVYGAVRMSDDGRAFRLGEPVALNVLILRSNFLPLSEILDARRAPTGGAGHAFYAQSWALAHYLLLGSEAHARQVAPFLARAAAGTPVVKAFEESFGPVAEMERELRRYIERENWGEKRYALPDAPQAVPMAPAEAETALGRLLFHAGRDADAEARLKRAIATDPSLWAAHLALGLLRARQGQGAEALGSLEKARALAPESLVPAFYLARTALRVQATGSADDETLESARAGLEKVLSPAVKVVEPWSVLGALLGRLGRLEEAERALRTALDLAPGHLQTIAELVDVLVVTERFDEAERLLDSAREAAVRTGSDLGPWRQRVAYERDVARIRADLEKAASLDRPKTLGPVKDKKVESHARTGRWLMPPDYRQTGPDEKRTHGLLRRIDCQAGHITVHVATADGTRRFTAKSLAAIQGISYREGFEPLLGCGPLRGMEPVFVTWKPAAGAAAGGSAPRAIEGTVVAVEFLGEEYLPRQR